MPLGRGLGRLGDGQRLVAGHAHEIALYGGERGAGTRRAERLGGREQRHQHERDDQRESLESHTLCPSSGSSAESSHWLVTWKRRSAAIRPLRLITNVSGTPVVPNARTKFPLTSRSTG